MKYRSRRDHSKTIEATDCVGYMLWKVAGPQGGENTCACPKDVWDEGWEPVPNADPWERCKELEEQVNHWRVKAECYGNIVHGVTPVLGASGHTVDRFREDGAVGTIKLSVESLVKERDNLRQMVDRLRQDNEHWTKRLQESYEESIDLRKEVASLKNRLAERNATT
jgi:hypothetical protein